MTIAQVSPLDVALPALAPGNVAGTPGGRHPPNPSALAAAAVPSPAAADVEEPPPLALYDAGGRLSAPRDAAPPEAVAARPRLDLLA